MTKFTSLAFLCLLFLMSSTNFYGSMAGVVKEWCVAKPSTGEPELQNNIDFVCNQGFDCSWIQPGGPCYFPGSLHNHASVVMNLYYQKLGRHPHNCNFMSSGLVAITDPSYESCLYPYGP